jgi:hypothetical protein
MNESRRTLAPAQLLFIIPALLFLAAVVVQNLGSLQHEPAHTAHQIVMWYALWIWTLWLLLTALPLLALVMGFVILLPALDGRTTRRRIIATICANRTLQLISAVTLTSGAVLLIVIAHVAAT